MLCRDCEEFRFPHLANSKQRSATSRKERAASKSKLKSGNDDVNQHKITDDVTIRLLAEPSTSVNLETETIANTGASIEPFVVSSGVDAVTPQIIINELLTYIRQYRDGAHDDSLRRVTLDSFPPAEITEAKKVLIRQYKPFLEHCNLTAERRNSPSRSAHEVEIDDIIGIFNTVDIQSGLGSSIFAAVDLNMLPKFGPTEINIAAIVKKQNQTELAIDKIMANMNEMAITKPESTAVSVPASSNVQSLLTEMQQKLETFSSSVNARLDHLNSVCRASLTAASKQEQSGLSEHQPHTDRKSNIVVFGIKENRDPEVWHRNVDDALKFITDRPVDVLDMLRLGRFNANKTRPILVKLRVVWDRRLILSKCSKLKSYDQRGIFVAPDEPIEVRRKQAFDRLKYRAERDGKIVTVVNNVLSVDGVATFSIVDGYINTT